MLQIYGVPVSVHTRKVIVAAIEKGLPYDITAVVPVIPGNPPAHWRTLSPTGLIPALTDGEFTLADSTAICAYLERTYPAHPLYPADAKAHALALWFEQYAGGTLFRQVVHPLFREVFVQPKVNQVPTDPAVVQAVLDGALPEAFDYLESVAGTSGFLTGPALTMGDIAIVSNLITLQYVGFPLDARRWPRLQALFERVLLQAAMRRAVQAEQDAVQAMGLDNACVRHVLA